MKLLVSLMLILPAVCICKPSSQNENLAEKKNETVLDLKEVMLLINILSQPGGRELLEKKIDMIEAMSKQNKHNGTTESEEGAPSSANKLPTGEETVETTTTETTTTKPMTTSNTEQGNSSTLSTKKPLLNSTTKGISTAINLKEVMLLINILSQPGGRELLEKKIDMIEAMSKQNKHNGTTESEEGAPSSANKLPTGEETVETTTTETTTTKPMTTSNTEQGNSSTLSTKKPLLNSTTKGISTAINLKEVMLLINILSQPGGRELLEKKIDMIEAMTKQNKHNGTTESEEGAPSSANKLPTEEETVETTTTETTTTKPMTTSNTEQGNSSTLSTKKPLLNSTTKGISTAINGNTDATKQVESTRIPLVHRSSNFPAIFMLILVIVVVIYFGYHNRNKIHQFIKTGYSRTKHSGSSYLKVKLEDDIDLPRDANTEYIY